MQVYALWGEVQEKLRQCAGRLEGPADFLEAMHMIYSEGRGHSAPCLPDMGMDQWDGADLAAFHRIMDRMPVDLGCFMEGRRQPSDPLTPTIREKMNALPAKIAAYQRRKLHAHSNYELFYAMKGQGGLCLQDRVIAVPEGTLCIIAPDFIHDVRAEPDSEMISMALWRGSMEQILKKLLHGENIMSEFFYNSLDCSRPGYVLMELPPDREVLRTIQQIFQEGYSGKSYAREIFFSYMELLFAYAVRSCARPGQAAGRERNGVPLAAVMKYIQDHYTTASLHEVAAAFHYDPDYLGKRIKACMGYGYSELVGKLKLEQAKTLLRSTSLPIEQVARLSGYGSIAYFSRTFRGQAGTTPTAYRKGQTGKSQI